MLTAAEIAAVPLFKDLPEAALERLARTSADMRLRPGEYAVHEGDPRALLVVMSGEMIATKLISGTVREIGRRRFGQLFGEVPLIFGTPFQASLHAGSEARVMRVEPLEYHAVAALAPEISQLMGEAARERMGGLQGLATELAKPQARMIGPKWDTASLELRRFLGGNLIIFEWLTPDDPELPHRWDGPLPEGEVYPILQLADGTVLIRPETRALAPMLGLQTSPSRAEADTVIIGGGPSGLAAAVYGASEGLRTVVVEREAPGGQAETSTRIENYLGFPTGISGDDLAGRALGQAKRLGAEIVVTRPIVGLDPARKVVSLEGGLEVAAKTIIIATGVAWRRLDHVPGLDRLVGRGVYYGAARSEASVAQGNDVHLVGAGNSAGQAALFLANHARMVTLIVRGAALEKSMSQYLVDRIKVKSNIKVALQSEVQTVFGEDHLSAIDILDPSTGQVRRTDSGALFIMIGADAETSWLPPEIARDERGYIQTGPEMTRAGRWSQDRPPFLLETSVPGIFACGDVRCGSVKRVASGVGEGAMAIAFVHQYLALAGASASD